MDEFSHSRFTTWLWQGVPVGRVHGIQIRLHLLLIVVLLYEWPGHGTANASLSLRIGLLLFSFAALFGSVLLHEFGHCYGAFRVGGAAEQIVLWPLGGLAYVSGGEKGPREELIVTLMGPAVSLALALLFGAIYYGGKYLVETYVAVPPFYLELALDLVRYAAFLNTMLFVFNMVMPLFPMDSARIVRALASYRWNPNRVTYVLATFGIWFGAALAIVSFFHVLPIAEFVNPWLGLIGLLGALVSYQERKRLEYGDVYEDGPWYWRDSFYQSETAPRRSVMAGVKSVFRGGGGLPTGPTPIKQPPTERDKLKRELELATEHEDFQRAAELRDRIRGLTAREKQRREGQK